MSFYLRKKNENIFLFSRIYENNFFYTLKGHGIYESLRTYKKILKIWLDKGINIIINCKEEYKQIINL